MPRHCLRLTTIGGRLRLHNWRLLPSLSCPLNRSVLWRDIIPWHKPIHPPRLGGFAAACEYALSGQATARRRRRAPGLLCQGSIPSQRCAGTNLQHNHRRSGRPHASLPRPRKRIAECSMPLPLGHPVEPAWKPAPSTLDRAGISTYRRGLRYWRTSFTAPSRVIGTERRLAADITSTTNCTSVLWLPRATTRATSCESKRNFALSCAFSWLMPLSLVMKLDNVYPQDVEHESFLITVTRFHPHWQRPRHPRASHDVSGHVLHARQALRQSRPFGTVWRVQRRSRSQARHLRRTRRQRTGPRSIAARRSWQTHVIVQ